jgi:hypothetical protein
MLLTGVLQEEPKCGWLGDDHSLFLPRHSMAVYLGHHTEAVDRNSDNTKLTHAVFINVVKDFDNVRFRFIL